MTLLDAHRLTKSFHRHHRFRHRHGDDPAVNDVSFTVERGETLALVGESGAGKSTTGRLVLRLIERDDGDIFFDGDDVGAFGRDQLRRFRRRAQMIFQDPYSSFDLRVPLGRSVAEPLVVHGIGDRAARQAKVADLFERVGLGQHLADRYPSQLSGGQLQRAAIARALATDPSLIVCDEPVAALDVSIQAQVVNLLMDLQVEQGISYLFITHDLALVESFAHRVAVMRRGSIVEQGTVTDIFSRPEDPYTRSLLDSIPYVEAL